METPESLEQQIHRIHELLERSHENVTWNDHIPDPDNPEQLRQIDITIRRNGIFTIIECRLSKRAQNVKWIEELIGRRQSLRADTIIAVASAGFTTGAKRKAARYGVLLRDLRELSTEEIASWGGQIALMLYYYQYSDVKVAIGFQPQSPDIDPAALKPELRSHGVLLSLFNAAAEQLDTLQLLAKDDTRTFRFGLVVCPHGDITTSYGTFGTASAGFDLSYGREKWGNFIAVDGLQTGRFLDPPEFAVMHDKGNESNVFDRFDIKPSDADTININFQFTRSWFQTPNSFDAQNATAWSGLVVDNGGLGPNGLPVGVQDQRAKIRTYNIAPISVASRNIPTTQITTN